MDKLVIAPEPIHGINEYTFTYTGITDAQVEAALAEHVATRGYSIAPRNQNDYIFAYAAANNIDRVGINIRRHERTGNYSYSYQYTNITEEEIDSLALIAQDLNNNIPVSPDILNALIMTFARFASREITSERVINEDVLREGRQDRASARQSRATALLRSNRLNTTLARRRQSAARANRTQSRTVRDTQNQYLENLTRNRRR